MLKHFRQYTTARAVCSSVLAEYLAVGSKGSPFKFPLPSSAETAPAARDLNGAVPWVMQQGSLAILIPEEISAMGRGYAYTCCGGSDLDTRRLYLTEGLRRLSHSLVARR